MKYTSIALKFGLVMCDNIDLSIYQLYQYYCLSRLRLTNSLYRDTVMCVHAL